MDLLLNICLGLVTLGLGLSALRVFINSCYANKILGADFMLTALIALLGVIAVYTDNLFYLDVAMLVGIISFLSTVYFAKFLANETDNDDK